MTKNMLALAAAAVLLLAGHAARADGDADHGAQIFKRCGACHTIDKGGPTKIGPNLYGVVGRKSGSIEGFNYSDAMKNSNLTWNEATLNTYLTNPKALVPGNKMAFPGLPNEQDRLDVIAYLKKAGTQ